MQEASGSNPLISIYRSFQAIDQPTHLFVWHQAHRNEACLRHLKINPALALPKEKERVVTETQSEVRFLMSDILKAKLKGVRSLLGARGALMTYAELFDVMSDLSLSALEAKQFGKKRSQETKTKPADAWEAIFPESDVKATKDKALDATSTVNSCNDSRYISKGLKHQRNFDA